jgi:hypothetical protein
MESVLCTAILSVEESGEMWLLTDMHRPVRYGNVLSEHCIATLSFKERKKRE